MLIVKLKLGVESTFSLGNWSILGWSEMNKQVDDNNNSSIDFTLLYFSPAIE